MLAQRRSLGGWQGASGQEMHEERRAKHKTAVLGKPVSAYLIAREETVHPRGKFRKLFITRHEMVLQEKLGGRQQ